MAILIGLTGTNAAGKGTVAEYLKTKGFGYFSLSDILRDIAKERGEEESRVVLVGIGNELRQKHGAGALALMTLKKIKAKGIEKAVIDSIRNPMEIEELRKAKGFVLIGVDADIKLRFERSKSRGRAENASTLEEFKAQEDKEKSADPNAQQLHKCMDMADYKLENNKTIKELYKRADSLAFFR